MSWITILRKRENYWQAFDNFDPNKIARYGDAKIEKLLGNSGIVRNRLKINAAVKHARGYLDIMAKESSFSDFLWQFVNGSPNLNEWLSMADIPTPSPESRAMSVALKQRGFSFVGETICYAFMQAVGLCNDHVVTCFRHEECKALARKP